MKVGITYLNRHIADVKVSFPKLNNFTRELVVDTLQLQYVVYKFGFGPYQIRPNMEHRLVTAGYFELWITMRLARATMN